eukprot:3902558-Pleurochrysis_carterae.AAC.1
MERHQALHSPLSYWARKRPKVVTTPRPLPSPLFSLLRPVCTSPGWVCLLRPRVHPRASLH